MNAPSLAAAYDEAKARTAPMAALDQVYGVVALARKLALENFYLHLAAVTSAQDEAEKEDAVGRLLKATEAVAVTSQAYKSFVTSESNLAQATAQTAAGDMSAAHAASQAAGTEMEMVGDRLDRFADYAPKSRLFGKALQGIAAADAYTGKVETSAARSVDGFVKGLKAFARQLIDFAREIAEKVGHQVSSFRSAAKQSALDTLDRAGEIAEQLGKAVDAAADTVHRAASTVNLHATAAVGVASGLAHSVGSAVAHSYAQNLQRAAAQQGVPAAGAARERVEGSFGSPLTSAADQPGFVIRGFADGALLEDRATGTTIRCFSNDELATIAPSTTAVVPGIEIQVSRFARLEARLKEVVASASVDNPSTAVLHARLKAADFAAASQHAVIVDVPQEASASQVAPTSGAALRERLEGHLSLVPVDVDLGAPAASQFERARA